MMIKRENKYFPVFLSVFLLFSFVFPAAAMPAKVLTSKTLADDLNYYRKTSEEKSLNANGRYYILTRIENKYKNTDVNLAPLIKELEKLKSFEEKENKIITGTVDDISVSEEDGYSKIKIYAKGAKRQNYFVLTDPDPALNPKIVLDLYGAEDKLPEKKRNVTVPENSVFISVKSGQFETKPDKIFRVVAEIPKDAKYKVSKESGSLWVISSKNPNFKPEEKPAEKAAAVIPLKKGLPKDTISSTYIIETGDILAISVYPAEELSRSVVVQPDGYIAFPLIGSEKAKGFSPEILEKNLTDKLGKYVASPKITVSMQQFSNRQVFITGQVRSVGARAYKENLRLMEFISSVGGFTEDANRREIKIYRGPAENRQVFNVDVEQIVKSGDFSKDFILEPGDIIEVPKGADKISVIGAVSSQGNYSFEDNLKLLELVSKAGGVTDDANIKKINIITPDGKSGQTVEKINFSKILKGEKNDIPLKPGQTIYIPKKKMASANSFLGTLMPWLSLISIILVIRTGI